MEVASGVNPSAADAALTVAQTFSLSSRPGAVKKILLDFDGHITTGSVWNDANGIYPIVSPAYDKDGDSTNWTADELADIYSIWRAVSEDYAMFDVDVTTADPGDAALVGNGVRMVIGGSYNDWLGYPAGGIAYMTSFGIFNTPAFIFPRNLGPNNAKYIADATSHEAGESCCWERGDCLMLLLQYTPICDPANL